MTQVAKLLEECWVFHRANGWYPIQPSTKCTPERHAELNPGTTKITREPDGRVLWAEDGDYDEPIGRCESCSRMIMPGDQYQPCTDGVMLCADHAAMLSDVIQQFQEITDEASDPVLPGDMTVEEVRANLSMMQEDLAANGDRKVLYTA